MYFEVTVLRRTHEPPRRCIPVLLVRWKREELDLTGVSPCTNQTLGFNPSRKSVNLGQKPADHGDVAETRRLGSISDGVI